jgi:hypothetical protein
LDHIGRVDIGVGAEALNQPRPLRKFEVATDPGAEYQTKSLTLKLRSKVENSFRCLLEDLTHARH